MIVSSALAIDGSDSRHPSLKKIIICRYIDRQYELQGYRIPLPESEELNVPKPQGVDKDEKENTPDDTS